MTTHNATSVACPYGADCKYDPCPYGSHPSSGASGAKSKVERFADAKVDAGLGVGDDDDRVATIDDAPKPGHGTTHTTHTTHKRK